MMERFIAQVRALELPPGVRARIIRYAVQEGECVVWTGCLSDGYARLRVNGRLTRVSRVISGTPEHLLALHTCDNRPCINPDHLYHGTHLQNSHDMWERNPPSWAKLQKVIPKIRKSNEKNRVLAERYGVTPASIWVARHRPTWKELAA